MPSENHRDLEITQRTRLRRMRERGHFDRDTIDAILDAMPLCHVGYVQGDSPVVMPTIQWREGDHIYWHASSGGRGIKSAEDSEVCVTVTLLDGLVLARSGLHHSANYRSVMVFGIPHRVTDPLEKRDRLNALIDTLYPGRSSTLREMTEIEVRQTTVLSLPLNEASAKIRAACVADDEEDYALPIWAGVIPMRTVALEPEPDPRNLPDLSIPDHVSNCRFGQAGN